MTGVTGDFSHETSALRRAIAEAVARRLMDGTEGRPELAALSPRTLVDGVEVFESDLKFGGDRFEGLFNVHCILRYDEGRDGAFETSETFPGRFEGTVRPDGPSITHLSVDTTSIYS